MKVIISGASGFIGTELKRALTGRHELVCLKRKKPLRQQSGYREILWDPQTAGDWMKEMDGADAVINLSGEPIAGKRWTAARKKELILSRLTTTRALVEAIGKAGAKPRVLLNASAIGWYGDRGAEPLEESSKPGAGFLPDLCKEWERQASKADAYGVRVVLLRTGIVLGRGGGALAKMLPPFRLGLGGPLGSGRQVMSWIHLEDEVGAIVFALENPAVKGPVNLTAPEPVSMSEFALGLGKALHRPAVLPAPAFVLKALLGEMSELLLTGQKVLPQALLSAGYRFRYPALEPALKDLTAPIKHT